MDNINTSTLPIGFFDSGVGGLSVLVRFRELLPAENLIYFGDTIHLPYGNKSKDELIGYARYILNFMQKQNVKAVIIACNTSSAQAYDTVKGDYNFPIYPIIQTSAKELMKNNYDRIGVFATEATVKSGKYTSELIKYNPNIKVKEMASKNWVSIVEKTSLNIDEDIKNIETEINEMLAFKPDKIILGCTHYPYLLEYLTKYAPKEIFIDPAILFVSSVKADLEDKNLLPKNANNKGYEKYFVSSNPEAFVKNAKIFCNIKELPTIV